VKAQPVTLDALVAGLVSRSAHPARRSDIADASFTNLSYHLAYVTAMDP
jgi:hypothetical protein